MSVPFFSGNFLMTGLCNSLANSLFEIFSFFNILPEADLSYIANVFYCAGTAVPPEVFLSENL